MKYSTILTLLAVAGVVGTTSGAHATAASTSTRDENVDEVSLTSNTNLRSAIVGAAKEDSIDQTERELPEVNRIINNKKKKPPFLEDKKYDFNPGSALAIKGTDITTPFVSQDWTHQTWRQEKHMSGRLAKATLLPYSFRPLAQARIQILLSHHKLSSTFSSLALWASSCRQASPCLRQDLSVRRMS